MMPSKPEPQHEWLKQLLGDWTYEFECPVPPDHKMTKFTGTESVRTIGDLWIQTEMHGTGPDGTPSVSQMTLGYDPAKQQFVGTWVGSMMSNLWVYEGFLEGDRILKLDTVGPSFDVPGSTANYQETLEIQSADVRLFSSAMQKGDGSWMTLMTMKYARAK